MSLKTDPLSYPPRIQRRVWSEMEPYEMDNQELADYVREFRGPRSRKQIANLLGMPARTLEAVENGRGFRYPRMLVNAIQGWIYLERREGERRDDA
jgi:hypothetical protein